MLETMAERLRFGFSVVVSPELLPDGNVWRGLGGERGCGERGGRSVEKDFFLPGANGEDPGDITSSTSVLKTYSTIPVVRARV
jgi:hypothetical protein